MRKSVSYVLPTALLAAGASLLATSPAMADETVAGAQTTQISNYDAAVRAAVAEKWRYDAAVRAAVAAKWRYDAAVRAAVAAKWRYDAAVRAAVAQKWRAAAAAANPGAAASGNYSASEAWASSGFAQSVIRCESGGNYSINTGNGYYGAWQFDYSTWHANGGGQFAAYPHMASPAQQNLIAYRTWQARGWQPWACA